MSRVRNNTDADPSVPNSNGWQSYSICLSAEHARMPHGSFRVRAHAHTYTCMLSTTQCGCQRTTYRSWFSSSTMWILGVELGSPAWQQALQPAEPFLVTRMVPHLCPSSSLLSHICFFICSVLSFQNYCVNGGLLYFTSVILWRIS